jgi:hypothetical protein
VRGCAGVRVCGCDVAHGHSERAQPPTVIPSERSPQLSFRASAAPNCHSERAQRVEESARCGFEIAAQRVFTQRRRGAQRRRGLRSDSRSGAATRLLSIHDPNRRSWGRHSAGRGAAAWLGPPQAPRLRVISSRKAKATATAFHAEPRRRGEIPSGSRSPCVARRVSIHNSKQKDCGVRIQPVSAPRPFRVLCASAALSASASTTRCATEHAAPLRQEHVARRSTPRLGVKTRCATEPAVPRRETRCPTIYPRETGPVGRARC